MSSRVPERRQVVVDRLAGASVASLERPPLAFFALDAASLAEAGQRPAEPAVSQRRLRRSIKEPGEELGPVYVQHVLLFVFALGEVAPDDDHRLNPGPPPREALELLPQLGSSSTGRSS